MTPGWHYGQAERLLQMVEAGGMNVKEANVAVQCAQVHAALAAVKLETR